MSIYYETYGMVFDVVIILMCCSVCSGGYRSDSAKTMLLPMLSLEIFSEALVRILIVFYINYRLNQAKRSTHSF